MPLLHVVTDLETRSDPSVPFDARVLKMRGWDPEYQTGFEIYDAKPFPPPPCHQIVCIGRAVFEDYVPKSLKVVGSIDKEESEEDQLKSFLAYVERKSPTLVTWNGRGFDIPVLMTRAMKYGFPCPGWYSSRSTRYRYSDQGHFDVADFLSDFGATRTSQMGHVAAMLGMPGKLGTDGGDVEKMAAEGRIREIKQYCLSDVLQEAIIWLRLEVLRGNLELPIYQDSVHKLRELVQTDPEASLPEAFVMAFDWDAVLLMRKEEPEAKPNSPEDLGFAKKAKR